MRVSMLLVFLFMHVLALVPSSAELIGRTSLLCESPRNKTTEPLTVLVLGSGGLVGSALVQELRRHGYNVLESRNRMHLDLRRKGSLDVFDSNAISFCFFLACEVGGSKFIASGSNDEAIWKYNVEIYDNVLPYLERRKIPYIFSSSQLSVTGTAYGKVKAKGEQLVAASKFGKYLRFWNVYGPEKIGAKSHIIGDWIYQCVKFGQVSSHTSGWEKRQFVHADDMAVGLIDLMLNFKNLTQRVDITNGEWVSMRHIASLIQQHGRRACRFHFAQKNSSTMIGIEPEFLWQVSSNLNPRLQQMFAYYEGVVVRETYVRHQEPYVSFIMCTRNDNHFNVRARTFNSIATLASNAASAHLSYELVMVQYNPKLSTDYWGHNFYPQDPKSDRDLPFSQLFPWTDTQSFGNLRVITVPSDLHKWADQGNLWEYTAKNVGGVRARGKFLVFTSPDDIFPLGLIEQLSKQQLEHNKIYRAGVIDNFNQSYDASKLSHACNLLSISITASPPQVGSCADVAPTKEQRSGIGKLNMDVIAGGKPSLNFGMIEDFTIMSKEVFLDSAGYLEVPQNKNLAQGHLSALQSSRTLICHIMDHYICHQAHNRTDEPAPLGLKEIAQLHANRTDFDTFGLQLVDLPDARMDNLLLSAYNPEDPFRLYQHHHLFMMFKKVLWSGKLDNNFITDFLGIRTSYYFDCGDTGRYRFYHLSRRIPCARHDEFFRQGYTQTDYSIYGDLPIVDEEYFEYISLLRAVSNQLPKPVNQPFVVLEFGARYGTWVVRGGAAMRALQPHRPLKLLAVEADEAGHVWLQQHLQENGLASVTRAVRGFVAEGKQNVVFNAWERDSPARSNVTSYTIRELLAEYEHVDIIHCDIQGYEGIFVHEMELLNSKVKAVHFGTHNTPVHLALEKVFVEHGWTVTINIIDNGGQHPGRTEQTAFGPIRILWDGILAFENPRFVNHADDNS